MELQFRLVQPIETTGLLDVQEVLIRIPTILSLYYIQTRSKYNTEIDLILPPMGWRVTVAVLEVAYSMQASPYNPHEGCGHKLGRGIHGIIDDTLE